MNEQDNSVENAGFKVDPKEGERPLLSCKNTAGIRSPSLGFNSNSPLVSEKMQIDYLASILVSIYLKSKQNGNSNKKGGDILPIGSTKTRQE